MFHDVLRAWSLVFLFAVPIRCMAQVTFIGPTPYLSAADSPFDMSGLGSTFFFEDFEDGVFELPPGVDAHPNEIVGPGPLTDSVDGDDGAIDGSGNGGHSLKPLLVTSNPTNPPIWDTHLIVNFDAQQLGFLPNALGFVWTDGLSTSDLRVIVRDDTLATIGVAFFPPLMDDSHMGESAEDRFIGLVSDRGFRQVRILNSYRGVRMDHFELDHIQFGLQVSEPTSNVVSFFCIWVVAGLRSVVHRRINGEQGQALYIGSRRWAV